MRYIYLRRVLQYSVQYSEILTVLLFLIYRLSLIGCKFNTKQSKAKHNDRKLYISTQNCIVVSP